MGSRHTQRLMAVLAHPDDESLGVGGTLAKYASEGVDVFLLTATRGDGGRFRGHRSDDHQHPGPAGAGGDPRGGAAGRRVGVGRARSVSARLSGSAARSCRSTRGGRAHRRAFEAGSSRRRRDVRARRRVRASGSHRDLPIHDGGHRRRGRRRVRLRRAATAPCDRMRCRSCITWPGRSRPGRPTRPRFTKLVAHRRRRRTAGDAVARLGDHHRDRYAPVSGRRCGGRSRATSRRSPPTNG